MCLKRESSSDEQISGLGWGEGGLQRRISHTEVFGTMGQLYVLTVVGVHESVHVLKFIELYVKKVNFAVCA